MVQVTWQIVITNIVHINKFKRNTKRTEIQRFLHTFNKNTEQNNTTAITNHSNCQESAGKQ